MAARRAVLVRPLEDLAALEVVRPGAVVLAAGPLSHVAVAVGVDVHAMAFLLAHVPVARVLVPAVVVVHAVAVPLAILDVADVLCRSTRAFTLVCGQRGRKHACTPAIGSRAFAKLLSPL